MSKIFREERAWKAVWHISPLSDYLEKNMEFKEVWGTTAGSSIRRFSPPVLQKPFLFPEQRGSWQMDRLSDKEETVRSQAHAVLCKHTHKALQTEQLPSVLWHMTAHLTVSPGRHMLHIQRICLDSALFPSSIFLALSHYIKLCTKPYPFPDLLILNAIFEIWSLLKAPRLMLLCSSASCLKKQSTGKLFLTADHNHPVS